MIAMSTTQGAEGNGDAHNGGQDGGGKAPQPHNTAWVVGLVLVAAGICALFRTALRVPLFGPFLFPTFVSSSHAWDLLFLPALGCVFLAWGVVVRKTGLLVPGGVLVGVGLGVMVNEGPLGFAGPDLQGGVILASLGFGMATVAALALLFVDRRAWWPLIPAALFGILGLALIVGGSGGLTAASAVAVPLALIGAGIVMVLRRRRGRP